jgi:predicted transcriptional regulator
MRQQPTITSKEMSDALQLSPDEVSQDLKRLRANGPIRRHDPTDRRVIAGPNGAGKTTFALTYLRQFPEAPAFVNADLIAAGLSPLAPEHQPPDCAAEPYA